MSDLGPRLERLGLSQYLEALVSEGFDTWATVLDITESDLSSLNVKLGHRRKLQRAIAESRGQSSDRPLSIALSKTTSVDGAYRSDDSAPESRAKQGDTPVAGAATNAKRKYRRHPKPDEHAPERPPSAYVIFSNQVRETLKGQDLSFTEIAKVVGERWQVLPAESRELCERQANVAKEKYYAELAEYKKTSQYLAYQKYLSEFKAKHAAPTKGKRSKLETETSTCTTSSVHDPGERPAAGRRVNSIQTDPFAAYHISEASPPIGPVRLPSGPTFPSKSTSPATHSLSGFNSPRMGDHYTPLSASPRSASLQKESFPDMYSSPIVRDARGQSDASLQYSSSTYGPTQSQLSSTAPPAAAYASHNQAPIDLPSRRSMREMTRLPPLTHEDTTLSSDSGHTSYTSSHPQSLLPVLDPSKSMRVLPAPVPTMGATPSPLDRPPPPPATSPPQHDYRTSAPLAALLRAGELARVADDEEMERESLL